MAAASLHGTDIGKILRETGPVVKCVLLQHQTSSGKDDHPSIALTTTTSPNNQNNHHHHRPVLAHMIQEIEVDTTPSKSQVQKVLGGPWTFLGQYESEGTMIIMRRPMPDDLENLSTAQLQELCKEYSIDLPAAADSQNHPDESARREQLLGVLQEAEEHMASQINPHKLQPPFDDIEIHGDLLLLRVAQTDEVLDRDDDDEEEEEDEEDSKPKAKSDDDVAAEETDQPAAQDLTVLSNQEFFLDYTKEEYIAFASRTDVVAPTPPERDSDESEEDEDDDEEEDDDFVLGEDDEEDYDQGEKEGLLNLLMNGVLRKFREDNGRGPNTEELLALRSTVAEKLGVDVASVPQDDGNQEKKRASEDSQSGGTPSKKVKFSADDDDDGEGDKEDAAGDDKPASAESNRDSES